MPYWYYDKKALLNTPSFQDGIDHDTEMRYRKEGARFIIDTGSNMDLGYNTVATGVVYFHRFYMFHSLRTFPRYITACCCLFLAGKVEETPKKCKDIIKQAKTILSEQKFASFGEDPKEEVMTLERILLQTIKFELQVEHPYSYLLKYAKCLKGDKNKLQKMVQMAWTFVNDSLCTTLCLQWEPEVIAVALMFLAGKLSKFEVTDWNGRQPKHTYWWDMFVEDITMELLEDICHQVLDLYSPQNQPGQESPPLPPPPSKNDKKPSATPPVSGSPIVPVAPTNGTDTARPTAEGPMIQRLAPPQPIPTLPNSFLPIPVPQSVSLSQHYHATPPPSVFPQHTSVIPTHTTIAPSLSTGLPAHNNIMPLQIHNPALPPHSTGAPPLHRPPPPNSYSLPPPGPFTHPPPNHPPPPYYPPA